MDFAKIFFLCTLCFKSTFCIDQASFYGNSFITLPFKEAKSTTEIHFKFRTYLSNSLIFLVAGSTDYCIVELENSRLKVNINLGAGESELFSPPGLKLNDFKWHLVTIDRKEANLSMTVDKTHKVQKHLPGKFFELNIHYGLFVGDHKNKNNSDIFFGHVGKYRGCLAEMRYNGISVLEEARHRKSQATVQGVTWNCAAEFDAPVDRSISFVEDDNYMVVNQKTHYKELKLSFEIKTIALDGLLFYNPGRMMKPDFFLIEIHNQTIRCVIKTNDKIQKITNKMIVSDGEWHKVTFRSNSELVELNVDNSLYSEANGNKAIFQFSDSSYLGGLEISKRFRATSKGCSKSCDVSFKGCMRHLSILDMKKGLPDAYITEGLLPGCVWHYPCYQNPCKDNSKCVQKGLDSFMCECKDQFCLKSNFSDPYKVFSKSPLATELEILSVEPLEVLEGQNQIITTNNLHMILDYQKYGIKDSGINFYVVEGPEHGSIQIDSWPHEKSSFSLSDIARDKVHYIHDGSEHDHDSLVLDMDFSNLDSFILPVYLQGKFRFVLSVIVSAMNDPPVLRNAETAVLRIVQGTRKTVGNTVLNADDSDSVPSEIVYNILKSDSGYFENIKSLGTKLSSFTQENIDKEEIFFVDASNGSTNDSFVSLQISDGIETSRIYKVRVSISPLFWRLKNNTGLVILPQSFGVITPFNLSFVSNVPDVEFKSQFFLIKKPIFGVIEVEKDINHWEAVESFSSNDLKQHRVRYRHTNGKPEFDEFQFRITLDKSSLYTFRITFTKCTLYKIKKETIVLENSWEKPITSLSLLFETAPKKPLTSINYFIDKPPQYGYLFSSVSKYKMRSCDTFTQEDILSGNIKYKLYQKAYSEVEDSFSFLVLSSGCNNITAISEIKYYPPLELKTKIKVTLRQLRLDEGTSSAITISHLFIEADFLDELGFNVTQKPQHGFLQSKLNGIVTNNTDYFTLKELRENSVLYFHDGSETEQDSFTFMALNDEKEFEYVNVMNIQIDLKNDNSPVRAVDKIFNVVVGGERLITGKDLRYSDEDKGTLPSNIVYTCRESPNGNFYYLRNQTHRITEFTQKDLNDGLVLFKHKGLEFGKVRLWVTDGQFHVNGILEIQASAPFIHAITNKKLIVEQGKLALITPDHLQYDTNLFASDNDVIYEITDKPLFGKLVFTTSLKPVRTFSQKDVNDEQISYLNEHSESNADEISLRVRCKDAVNVIKLGVWILPSVYWDAINVRTLRKLAVEESTSALINKAVLEVAQLTVPPSALVFYIDQMPQNGYIMLSDPNNNEPTNVASFTQEMVNDNKVLYIQSATNQTRDKIVFNVTNGIVWLRQLKLNIEIIPERLYLGTNNLNVGEGGFAPITGQNLFVITDYYKNKVTGYTLIKEPRYGCVQTHSRCLKTKSFSQKEFLAGLVRYEHFGSEDLQDEIGLVADVGTKRSVPVILKIIINPVNDQKPKLVNNTGLVMWEGGISTITNAMLAAVDDDRPPETLIYHVQSCWWGSLYLTLNNSHTTQFTQEMINKKLVVFKHQNGTEGRFKFYVTDGVHTTKEHVFNIRTEQVVLSLQTRPLHIFPLQRKYITSAHLLATVSDPDRIVDFEVTTAPSLGRLMMDKNNEIKVVSRFTQQDLNESKVYYEHIHPFSDLYVNDSFVFNVHSHLAQPILQQILHIDISVSSGDLDAYVIIPKITVDEGGTTNVVLNLSGVVTFLENHANLRAPIIHASASTPQHGQVFLQNNKSLATFTQQQLEAGQVYYEHDHSDSIADNLHFSLYLLPSYVVLCNITVPVTVNPINDQPFTLVTPAPSLKVVQGENHTITRSELSTEDADSPPDKLKYIVIKSPSQGKLVLLPDRVSTMYFTQQDIDDEKLVYIHGGGSVLKDSFHFRVSDDKFRPEYVLFNIMVVPINISISAGLPVYLQQGSDVVFLTEKQFFITTNADKAKVTYTIKRPPQHGILYVKDNPTMFFTQLDLTSESVMYLQTDMTTANDSFLVCGEIASGNNSYGDEVMVGVKVQPLMQLRNFTAIAGQNNKLVLQVIDATPLAKLTNSNPKYTIVTLPQHGQVRKIIRSSGERRNVFDTAIQSFTHEEVQSGLIYLNVKDIEVPWNGLQDRLVFMLAASIFQPAVGELKITIRSSMHNEIYSTLAGPSDPAGHEGGLHLASPNMTRDYLLIVSMVAGVVVLGVAVIIIIKCRSLEVEELQKEEQNLQPIPLPRPPDRLMSSSPSLKHLDGYSSSTPQCKVTPLSRTELDSNACYPYGVEEHPDDWSSCDASDPPCPSKNIMLRRNQYWV